MKRRGVVPIRKCRLAGLLLLTAFWSIQCIILLLSLWKQQQQFERELSQPNHAGLMNSSSSGKNPANVADQQYLVEVITPSRSHPQPEPSVNHQRHSNPTLLPDERQIVEPMSSVDYFSCCGLGHRLSKMSDAYYVAKKKLNFQLRVFWATCELPDDIVTDTADKNNKQIEVFSYFFGPQPISEIQALQENQQTLRGNALDNYTTNHNLRLNNEIPGFKKFKRNSEEFYYVPLQQDNTINPPNRTTSQEVCPCRGLEDFFEETAEFHQSLKERFVTRHAALMDYWRDRFQFSNHTVYGLHVRAGNGENGDFLRKNRGLEDWEAWSSSMAETISQMIRRDDFRMTKPPLLFLATDTDSILHTLQKHLKGILPIVSLPQEREAEGSGVAFGNKILVHGKCLEKWQNSILDMMLLSDANVIIAGRPSSFTQSLPMSIALSRKHRNIRAPYCEVNRNATLSQCFSGFDDWCCKGKSGFHMEGIHPGYEYRRLPLALEEQDFVEKIQPRTAVNFEKVQLDPTLARRRIPLPYDWELAKK